MLNYVKPTLKRKADYVVLHVRINNVKNTTSTNILDKRLQLNTEVLDSDENCKVVLSQPMTRLDEGKVGFSISKLYLLEEMDILAVKNRNMTVNN